MDEHMDKKRQEFVENIASQLQETYEETSSEASFHPEKEGKDVFVRLLDHSGAVDDNFLEGGSLEAGTMEEVRGFMDLAHANAFARAYVRDSIERCRTPGASAREVLESWLSFGENAEICNAGEDVWKASTELDDFTAHPGTVMECDWRALDPRRLVDEAEFSPFMEEEEVPEEQHDIIRH